MGEIVVRGGLYGNVPWTAAWALSGYIREPEHYGYRTSVEWGEVRIGENRLSGIGGSQTMNAGIPIFIRFHAVWGWSV